MQSLSDDLRSQLFEFVANSFASSLEAITNTLAQASFQGQEQVEFVENVGNAVLNGHDKVDVSPLGLELWYQSAARPNGQILYEALVSGGASLSGQLMYAFLLDVSNM